MGTACEDVPLKPTIQDLKVKLHHSTLLFPTQKTQKKCCFLSNVDQNFNFYVATLHFFSANPNFPPETVAKRLKTAVEKVLVPYDFAAGTVQRNHQSGCLEIDCDAAGAGFVVASSEVSLDEIGDLVYPHQGYNQLAIQNLDNWEPNNDRQPLCIFQVTSFKCGGFSLSLSTNHLLFDGMGARTFLENVASQAFENKPLAIIPCNDRHLLTARSPPHVAFPHPELLPAKNIQALNCVKEELESKIFKLTSNQINYLKDKAKSNDGKKAAMTTTKITSFNAVAALIWRCKALSVDTEKDRISTLLCAVDIRSRLNPPLPPSYCGNAVLNAYASSKCLELEVAPFSELVGMVSNGTERVTDEYIRSTLDWIEINKGVPNGEYFISSWWRLGFEEVVYPWGKPIYSFPLMNQNKYICFLLPPDADDVIVNVLVTLPAKEMERFQSLFRGFFQY
ncbi:hypothetical protein BUALT_Bualt17G0032000 [Buddleja alternifolia]|uniref:Omega-hydroxypalmitate O-feruloyl transferase n=1 Tax=Buddleja alternifolia TaxID=168488 RepID=A0AAV6W5V0_9LAMI|nr:hypothetical protein BUALT_Bualt17G0032000 [Buddleja alternifolia]